MRAERDDNLAADRQDQDPLARADRQLVQRLQQGDVEAGHRFVQQHYPAVYHYLLYLTGRPELAEDLTQETFLQALRRLDTFAGRAPLGLWLHRIAHREFLQAVRRPRPLVPLEEVTEVEAPRRADWAEAIVLREAIGELPSGQQQVVILHYLQGYNCEEISQIVRAPVGTVKYWLSLARTHLQHELGEGDLSYLNETAAPMRQWAWLPLEQMDTLARHLTTRGAGQRRPGLEGPAAAEAGSQKEEEMDRRDFLRHAAVGAAGLMLPEAEKEIVDCRLTQKVNCAFKGMALSDLCDQLRADTGVQLAASPSVADEKVTLFCARTPLREVMRHLSRPFGYTWLRSGIPDQYRYELGQDLRSQLLEEELRNRDRNEALLALDQEMQRYWPYLGPSPAATLTRLRTAPDAKQLLEILSEDEEPWGALQMYFRLSPQEHAALRAGQTLIFSDEPRPGEHALPADLVPGVLESCRKRLIRSRHGQLEFVGAEGPSRDGLPPVVVSEARAYVELKITEREPGRFTLDGGAGVRIGDRGSWCVIGGLAVGVSPRTHQPRNRTVNHRLAADDQLGRRISVKPTPSCDKQDREAGLEAAAGPGNERRVTTADVLQALHRATDMPIVADYYTRLYLPATVRVTDQRLFDALNGLADTMRFRWQVDREKNWLQFRSTSYYDDRLKEVPNRLLARWSASRQKRGMLVLDDLIEIAMLSDAQLDAVEMAEGARACFGLAEWEAARNGNTRAHMRFLSVLSPAQRQAAVSTAGLSLAQLSPAQQQQFLAHLLPAEKDLDWESFLTDLRSIRLNVDYTVAGWYGWHAPEDLVGPGWPPLRPARVRERTLAAALQAARHYDPNVSQTQIVPTDLNVSFIYARRDSDALCVHWFRHNGHWSHRLPADGQGSS